MMLKIDKSGVNDVFHEHSTALHLAAITDQAECARLLIINGGASVNQQGYGRTYNMPLHVACHEGNFQTAEALLELVVTQWLCFRSRNEQTDSIHHLYEECRLQVTCRHQTAPVSKQTAGRLAMAGCRVLRGPDWQGGTIDGGEGHLGTITELLSDGRVRVLWDTGQETTCRAGADGKFDLRIFDTGQSGVRHPNTQCQECGEHIYGPLWRCKVCAGCDLCSRCYSDDKHDIRHRFLRIDSASSSGNEIKPRKTSLKMRAMGIFPGSKVTRGKHWMWGNQDGGPGTEGEMQGFENMAPDSVRSLVRVVWPSGSSNCYRLGFEGKVDLTCVDEEIGPYYYRDHLQLAGSSELLLQLASVKGNTSSLQETKSGILIDTLTAPASPLTTSVITATSASSSSLLSCVVSSSGSTSSQNSKPSMAVTGESQFPGDEATGTELAEDVVNEEVLLVGDKVMIGVDEERLTKLQEKYGGCTQGMIKRIGTEGVVTAVPSAPRAGITVKYTEKQRYRLNPAVLVKITSFTQGDIVRVRRDQRQLKFLNKKLGWSEAMEKACGKVGRVAGVASNGDVSVRLGGQDLTFNPSCLLPALGAPPDDVATEKESDGNAAGGMSVFKDADGGRDKDGDSDELMRLLGLRGEEEGSGKESSDPKVRQLFQSVRERDTRGVRRMIEADRGLLTGVDKDMTPLIFASYHGLIDIMKTLLDMGADLDGRDPKGRTPLVAATQGKEDRASILLIEKGANVNACNHRQRTPLHHAAFRNMSQVIQELILAGGDVNAMDVAGDTPLFDAIDRGADESIEVLLNAPDLNKYALNRNGFNMLHAACLRGSTRAVDMILSLEDHPDVDDRRLGEYTALHIAAFNDHVECAGLLILLGGATVDLCDGRRQATPLHLACKRGHIKSAELLVDMGANVNVTDIYGNTPLHLAVGKRVEDDSGSEDDNENTPEQCIRLARLLIDSGAFVDAVDYNGRTPTDYGQFAVQKAILQYIGDKGDAVLRCNTADVMPAVIATSDPFGKCPVSATGDSGDYGAADLTLPTPESSACSKQHDPDLLQGLLKGVSLQCATCDVMSDVTLQPCGHKSVCRKCSDTVTRCPVCGADVQDKEMENTDDDYRNDEENK